jgi:hypothetical protein
MIFSNVSQMTGKKHTMEFDMEEGEFAHLWKLWAHEGMLIQDAFPMLTREEREFIMTGITSEEWDSVMGEEE